MAVADTSAGAFNVGSDNTLVITGPTGIVLPRIITKFTYAQNTADVVSKAMDGVNRHRMLPQSWHGTFDIDRGDSTLDDLFAFMEAGFYNGAGIYLFQISQTIQDPGTGLLAQYRFTPVTMKLSNGGSWSGDAKVEQQVDWLSSFRRKVL